MFERTSERNFTLKYLSKFEILNICKVSNGKKENSKKRVCPSAGAIYPLSLCVYVNRSDDMESGLYLYKPMVNDLSTIKQISLSDEQIGNMFRDKDKSKFKNVSVILFYLKDDVSFNYLRNKYNTFVQFYFIEMGHCCQNVLLYCTSSNLKSFPDGTVRADAFKQNFDIKQNELIYSVLIGG